MILGALAGIARALYFTETRIDTVNTIWGFVVMSFHAAGDIDGNGDRDVLCNTWAATPSMRWYRNNGGSFAKKQHNRHRSLRLRAQGFHR